MNEIRLDINRQPKIYLDRINPLNTCSDNDFRKQDQNGEINGILVGDNGYTATNYMLTPVMNPTTLAQRRYNRAHITTRNVVERLFGQWKNKFRCFFQWNANEFRYCKICNRCTGNITQYSCQ